MNDRSINLSYEVTDEVPMIVYIDRNWVLRAVNNFLDNARKYINIGDSVYLIVYMNDATMHIEVRDNGPGIPQASQARIFERFYRMKEHESLKGSGLGLAITKSVAEAHGGTVYVKSKVGEGSTFGMTLPLKKDNERED